jgi:hypothetical protein
MLEAGSVSGFDAEEAVFAALSMRPEHVRAAPPAWVSCSPATPWGVHDRSLNHGACRRCGWGPVKDVMRVQR